MICWIDFLSESPAISKLLSYALECGEIDTYPLLVRLPKLKEPKKVFRSLTVKQFRDLVEVVANPYLQAMVAVIGEPGIRKGEAMSLTWSRVHLGRRMLWVEFAKDDEPSETPLSKYAARYLAGLVRLPGRVHSVRRDTPELRCH